MVSRTPPSEQFAGITNSDLAFTGKYAIQGNYNGFQVWDISEPGEPTLTTAYVCPASQSDVSVYKNLLFVSGEGPRGRLDCGTQGVQDTVSKDRLRGIRIFDITDIANPKNVGNVQTCRGSHTHTVLVDPQGQGERLRLRLGLRAGALAERAAGLLGCAPDEDPNSALFRIEVIKVPLAHPEQAAIVSSPRIFNDLVAPPEHGETPGGHRRGARRSSPRPRARGRLHRARSRARSRSSPLAVHSTDAGQHRQGARRQRRADRGRQRGAAGRRCRR